MHRRKKHGNSHCSHRIIAAIHWEYAASEENNKVFGRVQTFVAGSPKNMQFMIKDSKKYAATGAGASLTFGTASLPARRCTTPASPVTRLRKIATLSSPVTRLDPENRSRKEWDDDST